MSTIRGRRKTANMARDPRVSLCLYDPADPFQYVEVRGTVEMVEEGGNELIDELSRAYMGKPWKHRRAEVRLVVPLTPSKVVERVSVQSPSYVGGNDSGPAGRRLTRIAKQQGGGDKRDVAHRLREVAEHPVDCGSYSSASRPRSLRRKSRSSNQSIASSPGLLFLVRAHRARRVPHAPTSVPVAEPGVMMVLEINTSQGRGCRGDADRCRFVEMHSLRLLGSISRTTTLPTLPSSALSRAGTCESRKRLVRPLRGVRNRLRSGRR